MSDDPFAPKSDEGAKDPFDAPAIAPSEVEAFPSSAPSWDASEIATGDVPPFAVVPPSQMPKPAPSRPRCATHPDKLARPVACARCGNYACESCFSLDNEAYCSACADRVGMVLPWENASEGNLLRRLFHTWAHLAKSPYEHFGNIGDGDLGSALSFTATIAVVSFGSVLLLCTPLLLLGLVMVGMDAPSDGANLGLIVPLAIGGALIFPFLAAAMHMLSNLIWGSIYHAGAKLAGGQASYISSLRVAQYQSILLPPDVLISTASNVPLIGPLISLGWLAAKNILSIFAFAGHAAKQHRLEGATVWIVAAVPTLLALSAFIALLVLVVGLVLATVGQQGDAF